jgi:hypothetical protein
MGKKAPVLICVVLILVGGALGPGYWAYARYIAGDSITSFDAFATQNDGGTIQIGPITLSTSGEGKWSTPPPVKLSPEMNPVLLRLNVDSDRPYLSGRHEITYEVKLGNADRTLVDKKVRFSRTKDSKKRDGGIFRFSSGSSSGSQTVAVFDVPAAGEYTFAIKESSVGYQRLDVNRVEAVFRRNVLRLNVAVCVVGFMVFVAGIIVLAASTGNLHINTAGSNFD